MTRPADAAGTQSEVAKPRVPWGQRPVSIVLRSAVVPGWGQWVNRRHWKAVGFAAGQGYLAYRAISAAEKEHDWNRRARADSTQAELYHRRANYQRDRRHDFTWWSIFAFVFSLGDAYVDAQLGDFSGQFEPQDFAPREAERRGPDASGVSIRPFISPIFADRSGPVLSMGIRVRLP